ncbi:uncharacterized protein FYW47_003142 [Aplochiton taeniatus]
MQQSLPPKKHQCYFCLKEFPSASKLQRHNLVHTDLRPYLCLTCGKTFRQAPHLKVHERTHSRWKPIRQMTRQGLTSLTRERPRQPQYPKISICVPSKTIHVKTDTLHLSTDREADRISGTWGSQERRKNVPIKLNQLHHSKMRNKERNGSINDRQIAFEISGATDDADSYIKQGDVVENSLMAELPYWCEPVDLNHCYKCSMTFDSKGDLESHKCVTGSQTRVTQSSLYQCAVCFKEFVSPSKLKRHYVTHTGQRPFKCGVCDKTFTQSTHLKTHARCHRK